MPADGKRVELVRLDADELRVLTRISAASETGFFAWSGDSLVLADQALPGATEFSVEDGSSLGGFPGVPAARWIPFDLYGDGVLGFEAGRPPHAPIARTTAPSPPSAGSTATPTSATPGAWRSSSTTPCSCPARGTRACPPTA